MAKKFLAETPWLADVRVGLGARPDIYLWRQHAGLFIPYPAAPGQPPTQVAPDGTADIVGIQIRRVKQPNLRLIQAVNPDSMQPSEREVDYFYGAGFMIETKSSRGTQNLAQRRVESIWRAMGGDYILAPAADWKPIHAVLGAEPDPVCAKIAQERFATLRAVVDAWEAEQKSLQRLRDKQKRK